MVVFKNPQQELSRLRMRLVAAGGFVLVCFALLVARLVYLQIVQHEQFSDRAEANRVTVVPIVPNRGLIVDRNGVVLARENWRSEPAWCAVSIGLLAYWALTILLFEPPRRLRLRTLARAALDGWEGRADLAHLPRGANPHPSA